MAYFLAINYGAYEGWSLEEYLSLDVIAENIKLGGTIGNEFKVLKEIPLKIEDEDG